MTYVHGARREHLEALRIRQATAVAEAMSAEAELEATKNAAKNLIRSQARRDNALTELLKVRDKFASEAAAAEADLEVMLQARRDIAASARKAETATAKLQRELTRAEEAEIDLRRLQRERNRTRDKIRDKNVAAVATIHSITSLSELPPPIHGGREGLEAANREAAEHERAKRAVA